MEPQLQVLWHFSLFFVISLSIRALFSFLETTITTLRLFKLKEIESKIGKYKQLFETFEKNPQRILITILVANSLADVTTAALAAHIMETIFSYLNLSGGLGFSVGILFATIAIVLFGEIIPKNIAKTRGESFLMSTLWILQGIYTLLYPLVAVLFHFSELVTYLIGGRKQDNDWVTSESEIRFLISYIRELGLMEPEKSQMLQSIFELALTPVKEVMVPEIDIVSVDINAKFHEILQIFLKRNFTRLPVYKDNHENIVGIIHLKDVFLFMSKNQEISLTEIIRPILFVPESMKINQLLKEFTEKHRHMAMVLNEHGSIIGLVTLEDILEEIVGEINDEHELTSTKITHLNDNGWLADASTPLEDIEQLLNINFETANVFTLGGFITEKLQHLPKKGERILYKHFYFQVQKASPKRVLQVLIFKEKTSPRK